ncbi:baseplate J-like protein [Anopheles sinensis]|uniref:Baseplate J-like protein n=1 Tax=Anopheles sinensis TaxID=74873 RepID=A0A084VRJ4_ANOSI|nr:baseplate J-like protein [Anopheles sinensis]
MAIGGRYARRKVTCSKGFANATLTPLLSHVGLLSGICAADRARLAIADKDCLLFWTQFGRVLPVLGDVTS